MLVGPLEAKHVRLTEELQQVAVPEAALAMMHYSLRLSWNALSVCSVIHAMCWQDHFKLKLSGPLNYAESKRFLRLLLPGMGQADFRIFLHFKLLIPSQGSVEMYQVE